MQFKNEEKFDEIQYVILGYLLGQKSCQQIISNKQIKDTLAVMINLRKYSEDLKLNHE